MAPRKPANEDSAENKAPEPPIVTKTLEKSKDEVLTTTTVEVIPGEATPPSEQSPVLDPVTGKEKVPEI